MPIIPLEADFAQIALDAQRDYLVKILVDFGNYLLSDKRKQLIDDSGTGNYQLVSDADIKNFEEMLKSK